MEELAEVSPTSDSQAEGPEEPDSRLSAAAPGPPEAVSDPGPLQIDGLLGALRSRLQRTAAILAMSKAAAVPERGAAANPTPMRPPMTPPCSVAGSTAKAKGEGRPTPGPAVWPPMPASSATPAVWPAMPASSATPAVWAPPGPASSASSTTPAGSIQCFQYYSFYTWTNASTQWCNGQAPDRCVPGQKRGSAAFQKAKCQSF